MAGQMTPDGHEVHCCIRATGYREDCCCQPGEPLTVTDTPPPTLGSLLAKMAEAIHHLNNEPDQRRPDWMKDKP